MGVLSQDVGGALWAPLLVALLLALLTAGSYTLRGLRISSATLAEVLEPTNE